ncbi:MAG: FecR domain-containing protein [Cyanobacteria bacterium P01_F01_bin.4]
MNKYRLTWLLTSVACVSLIATQARARDLTVRVNRWLEFRTLSGSVQYASNGRTQRARVGARINAVGDSIRTGRRSSARLAVDTGIGFVTVAENTNLRISRLRTTPSGGRVTELDILQGQARLQVRPFTNRDSRLNIRTPAGVSGVRGTEFGVSVQASGSTGVATLEGAVVSSAEGVSVDVPANFQTLIVPGEPPLPPEPLRDDPRLDIEVLQTTNRDGVQIVELVGSTDPVNLFQINGEGQSVSKEGRFDLEISFPDDQQVLATVTTPLGTEQVYELVVP